MAGIKWIVISTLLYLSSVYHINAMETNIYHYEFQCSDSDSDSAEPEEDGYSGTINISIKGEYITLYHNNKQVLSTSITSDFVRMQPNHFSDTGEGEFIVFQHTPTDFYQFILRKEDSTSYVEKISIDYSDDMFFITCKEKPDYQNVINLMHYLKSKNVRTWDGSVESLTWERKY